MLWGDMQLERLPRSPGKDCSANLTQAGQHEVKIGSFEAVPVALAAPAARAIEPFVLQDIRVEGLQRIAPGTVFNYLPIKVGDTLTDSSARDAIAALFKTGFFQDVRLDRSGDVLVVQVKERPSIDSIQINGTKEIDEKTLLKSLKEIGLAEGLVFNSSLLDKTELELKRQYFSRGRYAVSLKTTVTPLERNQILRQRHCRAGQRNHLFPELR